jgi:hypothetical protein
MGDSRVRKFDELASTMNESPTGKTSIKGEGADGRKFSEWPLIRPLNSVARGIRDMVNCSLDAVRGRYDR